MGGVLILIALTIATLLWADLTNRYVWCVLIVTGGFGGVGFIDDYLKLTKRSSDGLPGRLKLLIQVVIATAVALCISHIALPGLATQLAVPSIGRTSGRERVGQCVKIRGVARQ